MTLTSASKCLYSTENTPQSFRVHLGKAHVFNEAYEVALAEIHVPLTLYTKKRTKISGGDGTMTKQVVFEDLADPNVSLLHVECSIIEDQVLDHSHHRYLRTINIKKEKYVHKAVKTYSFGRMFYYPLSTNHLSDIEINIKTDKDVLASFAGGTLTVLLHFRERRRNGS